MGSVFALFGGEYGGFAIDGMLCKVGVECFFPMLEKFVTAWRIIPGTNWHLYTSDCPTLDSLQYWVNVPEHRTKKK